MTQHKLTMQDLDQLFERLHVPVAQRYVSALFLMFDKDRSGFIEFEEFERFVLYEPFC